MSSVDVCDGCGKVAQFGEAHHWVEVHIQNRHNEFAHEDLVFCPKCLGIKDGDLAMGRDILKGLFKATKAYRQTHPLKKLPGRVQH